MHLQIALLCPAGLAWSGSYENLGEDLDTQELLLAEIFI
jgi:hypothetical protein